MEYCERGGRLIEFAAADNKLYFTNKFINIKSNVTTNFGLNHNYDWSKLFGSIQNYGKRKKILGDFY